MFRMAKLLVRTLTTCPREGETLLMMGDFRWPDSLLYLAKYDSKRGGLGEG